MSIHLNRPLSPSEALARNTDPQSSHDAAAIVDVGQLEARVLGALRVYGASTTEELADKSGIPLVSVSPRMKSLERKNLVARAGKRKNRSGVSAILWEAR